MLLINEIVAPNLKMKRETAETEGENRPPRSGSNAAKVSENAPRNGLWPEPDEPQIPSELQSAGCFTSGRKAEGKRRFTRCERKAATARWRCSHGTARLSGYAFGLKPDA